jgi:hypothetical protein
MSLTSIAEHVRSIGTGQPGRARSAFDRERQPCTNTEPRKISAELEALAS